MRYMLSCVDPTIAGFIAFFILHFRKELILFELKHGSSFMPKSLIDQIILRLGPKLGPNYVIILQFVLKLFSRAATTLHQYTWL